MFSTSTLQLTFKKLPLAEWGNSKEEYPQWPKK